MSAPTVVSKTAPPTVTCAARSARVLNGTREIAARITSSGASESRASSTAMSFGSRRRWRFGATSTTTPPAIVSFGVRSTKRSPRTTATAVSSLICAHAASPGRNVSASSRRTWPFASSANEWNVTCMLWRSACGRPATAWSRASSTSVALNVRGALATSPRRRSLLSMPVMFTAVRVPGDARSTESRCDCRPRTRPRRPPGITSISIPARSSPSISVPVTTVPKPPIVNTRSIGRRGRPISRFCGKPATAASSAASS